MEEEVFEVIISELDYYIIEKVRQMRIKNNPYLSMLQLSLRLELPVSAISKIENMKKRDKYNIRTLNKLANLFNLGSYMELFPDDIIKNDMVRLRLQKFTLKKGKQKVHDDGSVDRAYTIISIIPLNEKELALWNANKLPYLTLIK